MAPADALRNFLAPLLADWRIQFGRWTDGATTDRYAVIRPAGGLPAALVRRPEFTLTLIAAAGEAASVATDASEAVIAAVEADTANTLSMQAGEPTFSNTTDGRAVCELAISVIAIT
jgi:hypothetical protein